MRLYVQHRTGVLGVAVGNRSDKNRQRRMHDAPDGMGAHGYAVYYYFKFMPQHLKYQGSFYEQKLNKPALRKKHG